MSWIEALPGTSENVPCGPPASMLRVRVGSRARPPHQAPPSPVRERVTSMADRTAAQILIDTLVDAWGVRHIFSLPGDGINGIYEALRQRRDDVQLIQVRHEETAAL